MADMSIGKHLRMAVKDLMADDSEYTLSKDVPVAAPELIIGLELEIENWPRNRDRDYRGFNFVEDGSLRNNGTEAVSYPTKTKFIPALLKGFFTTNNITEVGNYSERCSTHVHVNVQDYTFDQLASLCLLYQVYERMLFNYVQHDRDKNIFCVPWCQANVNINLVEVIQKGDWRKLQKWSKYTALNLLAVSQKGTVEYRHLHGTCDVGLIMDWLNIIGSMHEYARNHPVEEIKGVILELNTSSAYDVFLQSVFGQFSNLLRKDDHRIAMELGVIDAKLMLTKDHGLLQATPPEDMFVRMTRAAEQLAAARAEAVPRNPLPVFVPHMQVVTEDVQQDVAATGLLPPMQPVDPANPAVRADANTALGQRYQFTNWFEDNPLPPGWGDGRDQDLNRAVERLQAQRAQIPGARPVAQQPHPNAVRADALRANVRLRNPNR